MPFFKDLSLETFFDRGGGGIYTLHCYKICISIKGRQILSTYKYGQTGGQCTCSLRGLKTILLVFRL